MNLHPDCIRAMERHADRHWFFRGREAIVTSFIPHDRRLRVLDVGCGTGHLGARIAAMGHDVTGIEPDPEMLALARARLPNVIVGDAVHIPFLDDQFDVVVATDVLEHVGDDRSAAMEILRVLRPGGRAVITVPAFRFLWGLQDERLGHCRRYTSASFTHLFSGFSVRKLSFYNTFLFPAILVTRVLCRAFPRFLRNRDEVDMTPVVLNSILLRILLVERAILRRLNLPFGVSLIAVVEKQV